MATVTRQPFAPLNEARLQTLTSVKNRQNAVPSANGAKRKAADIVDIDDSENVDPVVSSKRSKNANSLFPTQDFVKPSAFVLTKAATPLKDTIAPVTSLKAPSSVRRTLQPKSPAAQLKTTAAKSTPLSAPAGRSPTRSKRSGLLSTRRRTLGPYARVDPPQFNIASAAPFSLDAALKGTKPSYARSALSNHRAVAQVESETDMKSSWFFDIHEDTVEQEMTNLLQHGTCVLDISSDEESERKASRDRAEGRDKENVPPVDDVSQTAARFASRRTSEDDMVVEKERKAMGELDASAFYATGCDKTSIIIVPGDEEETDVEPDNENMIPSAFKFTSDDVEREPVEPVSDVQKTVDELMEKTEEQTPKEAAVLQPIEGTGESFELWESGSSKDDDK